EKEYTKPDGRGIDLFPSSLCSLSSICFLFVFFASLRLGVGFFSSQLRGLGGSADRFDELVLVALEDRAQIEQHAPFADAGHHRGLAEPQSRGEIRIAHLAWPQGNYDRRQWLVGK